MDDADRDPRGRPEGPLSSPGGGGPGPGRDPGWEPGRDPDWDEDTPRAAKALVVGLVVLLAGVGGWFLLRSGDGGEAEPARTTETAPPPTRPEPTQPEEAAPDLPALAASDSLVRDMAAALSERPAWTSWLVTDGLVRRFVATVASVSAGRSPASHVQPLEPEGDFVVEDVDGRTVIDPASHRRYDLHATVVASLDTEGVARLYRQLHPLFEEAHRELGLGDGTFDETFGRALGRLLAVEVPDGPIEVVADGGAWAFRDPALESSSPAAKHLVRMGPENARRVQEKLREIAQAIGVEVRPPPS